MQMNEEYLIIEARQLGSEVGLVFLEDEFGNVEEHSVRLGGGSLHVCEDCWTETTKYNIWFVDFLGLLLKIAQNLIV